MTYEPNPQQGQPPYPPPRGYPPPQYGPPPPQYGPPRPAKKKSSAGKILLITFAAIIVLCGGGVLIVALAAGGAKPGPSSGGGAAHAGMNQPARDGKFEFTVTKMQCGVPTVGDPAALGKTAQGQFCLVTVTVRNIGTQPQTFDGSDQKAHDAAGTTFADDTQAEIEANSNTQTFLDQINPGNAVTGLLVFDVPKTATIKTLELHDSPFSGGVIVTVA